MVLFEAIVVAELPQLVEPPQQQGPYSRTAAPLSSSTSAKPEPRFVLVLPHGDVHRLPKNVLSFCFPDLDELIRRPHAYEHSAEEYTFTLTPKDDARVHGYCRRYRIGLPAAGGRLDVWSPQAAAASDTAAETPAYQCICILSERPYLRFFSQCLQLLHASRMASGAVAMRLARALLQYNNAPQGSILPLRGLVGLPSVPGCLHLPRERLRVPPSIGLPLSDVPLSPLLMRLDAPALLLLYVAMLCERRIMFVGASLGTLTSCVHAAAALLQPFEWQHIFIPSLSVAYLPYCCAPNPYLIGLTPSQFSALVDEYDVGEIVLVSLDEGYVAVLNGGMPLVDLEAGGEAQPQTPNGYSASSGSGTPGGSGAGTAGYSSYSGPKLSQERAQARVASQLSGSGAGFSGGGGNSSTGLLALAEEVSEFAPGSPSASGAPSGEEGLAPWHSFNRSHTYDDDSVTSRLQRRAYMLRRLAARQVMRDRVARGFSKEPAPTATSAGAAARERLARGHSAAAAAASGKQATPPDRFTGVAAAAGSGPPDEAQQQLFSFGAEEEGEGGGEEEGDWGFGADGDDPFAGAGAASGGKPSRDDARSRSSTSGTSASAAPGPGSSAAGGGWGTVEDAGGPFTPGDDAAAAAAAVAASAVGAGGTIGKGTKLRRPRNPSAFVSPTGAAEAARAARAKWRAAAGLGAGGGGRDLTASSVGGAFLAELNNAITPAAAAARAPSSSSNLTASASAAALSSRPTSLPSSSLPSGGRAASGAGTSPPAALVVEASDYGATAPLPVDLSALSTTHHGAGPAWVDAGLQRRRSSLVHRGGGAADPASGSFSGGGGGSGSAGSGGGGNLLRRAAFQTMAKAGKALMAGIAGATGAGGGPATDCPGARLSHDVKAVYARERREGAFDEAALYAAVLAFTVVVFGRVTDFVHVEGASDLRAAQLHGGAVSPGRGGVPGSPGGSSSPSAASALDPKFAKEEFVRLTVRHPSIARLLEEAQHSQTLQAFAADAYIRQLVSRGSATGSRTSGGSGGTTPPPSSPHQAPPPASGAPQQPPASRFNILDIALTEAFGAAFLAGGSVGSLGSSGSASFAGGGGSMGAYGSPSAGGAGPAGLLGAAANYASVHRRVYAALSEVLVPWGDLPPGALGADRGLGGSAHSVPSALASLHAAAACVTAFTGRPPNLPTGLPEAPAPLVLTALRGLLVAATSNGPLPEEPPASIARVAAAATHDAQLCSVVLGVVWARLNDCADRNWGQGFRALTLLNALLRTGSPRVWSLSLSFLPLLTFLLAPQRALAARAGAVAEDLGGAVATYGIVAGAGAVARAKKGMFGGSAGPLAGLALHPGPNPLSSIGPTEGAALLTREAARAYGMLACPQHWMQERALAEGPGAVAGGASAPLAPPLPVPFTPPQAATAPAAAGLPPGWLPSPSAPSPYPIPHLPLSTSQLLAPYYAPSPPQPGTPAAALAAAATAMLALPVSALALPTAWLPSQADDGRAGHAPLQLLRGTSAAYGAVAPGVQAAGALPLAGVQRQPQAAQAPWEKVHGVAAPCMCSSSSRALRALAARYGPAPPPGAPAAASALVLRRPAHAPASTARRRSLSSVTAPASGAPSAPRCRSLREALTTPLGEPWGVVGTPARGAPAPGGPGAAGVPDRLWKHAPPSSSGPAAAISSAAAAGVGARGGFSPPLGAIPFEPPQSNLFDDFLSGGSTVVGVGSARSGPPVAAAATATGAAVAAPRGVPAASGPGVSRPATQASSIQQPQRQQQQQPSHGPAAVQRAVTQPPPARGGGPAAVGDLLSMGPSSSGQGSSSSSVFDLQKDLSLLLQPSVPAGGGVQAPQPARAAVPAPASAPRAAAPAPAGSNGGASSSAAAASTSDFDSWAVDPPAATPVAPAPSPATVQAQQPGARPSPPQPGSFSDGRRPRTASGKTRALVDIFPELGGSAGQPPAPSSSDFDVFGNDGSAAVAADAFGFEPVPPAVAGAVAASDSNDPFAF